LNLLVYENIQKKYQVVGCNVKGERRKTKDERRKTKDERRKTKDERRKTKDERRKTKDERQKAKGEKNQVSNSGAFSPEPFASFLNIKPFDNMRQPVVLFSHA